VAQTVDQATDPAHRAPQHHAGTAALGLAALGIVFGDIGTSPLYAVRESFGGHLHHLAVTEDNVLGILSLITWSLIIVISIKYLIFVMKADNNGEGGILALTALIKPPGRDEPKGRRRWLILVGLFGTALLFGDGAITPAISVLSAVEGAKLAAPQLDEYIVPISVVILIALFAFQHRGTATIGRLFGPVMAVWFSVLAALGLHQLSQRPGVIVALNPIHCVRFFVDNTGTGFLALGAVFLVVTGGEALYADMGHFGHRPIRLVWFVVVLPALLLHYYGQGALLIGDPAAIDEPLFRMAPTWGLKPLVVLATLATVIASQALISGVFSLTMQAIQLGYAPRHQIRHTSAESFGQVYVPFVNWALMVACIGLVIGFGSSDALASAYGVAVTATMVITTVLFYVVLRERFRWAKPAAVLLCSTFLVVDASFLIANLFKIPTGGWFPLVVAGAMFTLITTWHTGRRLVAEHMHRNDRPLGPYLDEVLGSDHPPRRVGGTAVYLFSSPGLAPPALVANVINNDVLHERVVVVTVETALEPTVSDTARATVTDVGQGVQSVVLRYGFMEQPDVPAGLRQGQAAEAVTDLEDATFILGSESITVTNRPGMAKWRERIFALLQRNATSVAAYFGLPPERTISISTLVDI